MNAARLGHDRTCPHCDSLVRGERLQEGTARTWLWRCECGWSQLVSESGVLHRGRVHELIEEGKGPQSKSATDFDSE